MRAVIYLRISDEKQIQNTSLHTQKQACQNYCDKQGDEVVDVVTDEAISAKKTNIQRVAELLDYCDRNHKKFDVLVVFKLDRFARSQQHHHYLRNKLLKKNIKLRSATEKIGENGSEKLIEGILAAVNEYDNDIRIERTRLGMIRKLDEGLFPWRPPVGYYLPKKKGNRLSVAKHDKNCNHGIAEIFRLYSKGLYSFRIISDRINKLKLTNYRGTNLKFYPQQIEKIINNIFYIGKTYNTLDKKIRDGLHKPLIDIYTWQQCRKVKEGREHKVIRRKFNDDFPLRGLVKGTCGHNYTGTFARSHTGKRYPYYLCNQRDNGNHRAGLLHDKFKNILEQIEPEKEKLDLYFEIFIEETNKVIHQDSQREIRLERNNQTTKNKLIRLAEMRMEGEIDKDTFLSIKKKLKGNQTLEEEQEEIDIHQLKQINWDEAIDKGKEYLTDIKDRWEHIDTQAKMNYQGLIFPEKIVWDKTDYQTPVLLEVLRDVNEGNFDNVTPLGIEPRLQG